MKLNNRERYKKLKQSDRMEYLSINSIYENRTNTYIGTICLLIGIKIFVILNFLSYLLSIAQAKGIAVSDIMQEAIKINILGFMGIIIFVFLTLIIEIMLLKFSYSTMKTRNKTLEKFLSERKV